MNANIKKLQIRLDESRTVERAMPDISLDLAPEFPRKWFENHPDKKPIVRIQKSGLSQEKLMKKMGDYWISDPNIEPSPEFLVYFIKKGIKDRLGARWTSYGRIIGEVNQEITLLYLLNVEEYELKPDNEFGDPLPEKGEAARFATIMSIHSVHATIGGLGEYPSRVIKQMENTLKEAPFNVVSLDPGISAKASWGGNESFKKLVASVDMLYNIINLFLN